MVLQSPLAGLPLAFAELFVGARGHMLSCTVHTAVHFPILKGYVLGLVLGLP